MTTIWKFQPAIEPSVTIMMPKGAQILHVGSQHGVLTMWALVNTLEPLEQRFFHIYGTGELMYGYPGQYVGTVIMKQFVWHLFEVC